MKTIDAATLSIICTAELQESRYGRFAPNLQEGHNLFRSDCSRSTRVAKGLV
jgi:hypothetical protein